MNHSAPATSGENRSGFAWARAVIWLYVGVIWFGTQPLANHGYKRWQVWELTPTLLMDHLFSTDDPAQPPRLSGWQYFPERIDLLAIAGAILVFAAAAGRLALRLVFRPKASEEPFVGLERHYWSLVVGLALWGTGTLLLGLAGFLHTNLFWVVGVGLVIGEGVATWREPRGDQPSRRPRLTRGSVGMLLVLAPFLLAMLLGSLQPPNDFDVKEYHLGGAKEFFQQGHVGFLAHDVYTSFPFLTEMLCLSGMVLRGDWYRGALAGQAVLAAFAPLTAIGLYLAARRWWGETTFPESRSPEVVAWAAVLVHLTCPWIYRISIIAYAEGGLACYLLAAFIGVLRAMEGPDPTTIRRWSLITGLAAGAAAGCKYPGVLTVVIPAAVTLFGSRVWTKTGDGHRPLRAAMGDLVAFAFGGLVTFGPWLAKNLYETGNPVYPLLFGLFGGRDWDAASHAKWQQGHPLPRFASISQWGRDTLDRLGDVFLGSDWQSALYLALGPAVVMAMLRTKVGIARRGLGLAVAYAVYLFVTWQLLTHRIDRFWVPMLPVLSLLAGVGLAELWHTAREVTAQRTREVQWTARAVVGLPISLVVLCQLALATSPVGGNNNYLAPLATARELVKTPGVALVEDLGLDATDKVLFVGDAELFDAEFAYEYNTVFDHSIFERDCSAAEPALAASEQRLRPAAEIRAAWQTRGITHLVVNWSELLRYRTTYKYTDFVHPSRFEALVQAGVLDPLPAPLERTHVLWGGGASEKRAEAERWAPGLKQPTPFGDTLRVFDVYRVRSATR